MTALQETLRPLAGDDANVIVFRERTVSRHQAWVVFRDSQLINASHLSRTSAHN